MAGIYIHIPFCKKKCSYCDFYSIANLKYIDTFIEVLLNEIETRSYLFRDFQVSTIYFGGGTPSLLTIEHLQAILNKVFDSFLLTATREITIELNPDDVSLQFLQGLFSVGFNRLSFGIQSLHDTDLLLLGRRHDAKQAIDAVSFAHSVGFSDISLDLIYGIPNSNLTKLEYTIEKFVELNVTHISAYSLTYEKNTLLHKRLANKEFCPISDDDNYEQYTFICRNLKKYGFLHYEISNFAKSGYVSHHNASYWLGVPYLGFGPSAHSFYEQCRLWNIAEIKKYNSDFNNTVEREYLSLTDRYNEYLMVSLRTFWGVDIFHIYKFYGYTYYSHFLKKVTFFLHQNKIIVLQNRYYISENAIFVSDSIIVELFY